ncbi:uncharacterized protein PFLUO_LOCUS1605 [Penicillium psychrofluorescens]|uniref:uncharacterized protein n=1 Tax=Penicillium psychrofluorescens TaxID=3158075 RepID=UPI003CCDD814
MMDVIPPSYESATARDAWAIIADYIPSSDLCAASLVCLRWHELFMPFLWGDPASHFGTDNDAVYVALTRFRRTLKYARLEVRSMTHTLHLPPALSEIYGGPRPGWLKDILEYLPCLQCLMVSRLPFFDHNAMSALQKQARSSKYNVRLLLAEREPNTTSSSLSETILRFPLLIYLDLSYTTPARDRSVLSSLSHLENLQVLKLRGVGLKDNDAEFLANAIGIRVRFLDLRNNMLTDMAVRSLLQASFVSQNSSGLHQRMRRPPNVFGESSRLPGMDLLMSSDLDEQFMKLLAQPATSNSFWLDDLPNSGITHLYIADNQLTVEGVAGLLASERLHVLDVGTVNTAEIVHGKSFPQTPPGSRYPGAEKLVPLLGNSAGDKLTYLRAHHAIATAEPRTKDFVSFRDLLPELQAIEAPHEFELDTSHEIHELPAENEPVFELAATSTGGSSRSASTIVSKQRPSLPREDEPLSAMRRGSAFAPEVVQPGGSLVSPKTDTPIIPSGSAPEGAPIDYCGSPIPMGDPRAHKIQELLAKRPSNQSLPLQGGNECRFPYLHPSHVPHLETLILTDVPSHIQGNSPILYALTRFITACSNETLLATLQAGSDYSLPPGQARIRAEQQRARSLFGLRRIILEITPTTPTSKLTSWKPTGYRHGTANSSTGDRDSEALWDAATNDFSFFGEEECGIPENDPGKYFPMAMLNEKVSLTPSDDESIHSRTESPLGRQSSVTSAATEKASPAPATDGLLSEIDVVKELAAFRRAKKTEYENAVRRERGRRCTTSGTGASSDRLSPSSPSPLPSTPSISMAQFVEGHWKGEVKVVRNSAPKGRTGLVDVYGNYFEKGYLYP